MCKACLLIDCAIAERYACVVLVITTAAGVNLALDSRDAAEFAWFDVLDTCEAEVAPVAGNTTISLLAHTDRVLYNTMARACCVNHGIAVDEVVAGLLLVGIDKNVGEKRT